MTNALISKTQKVINCISDSRKLQMTTLHTLLLVSFKQVLEWIKYRTARQSLKIQSTLAYRVLSQPPN